MTQLRKLWSGRVSRLEYLTGVVLAWVATILLVQLYLLIPVENGSVTIVLFIVVLPFVHNVCLRIRRWHDIGRSGWMELLCWVPIVGFFAMCYVLLARGEDAQNKFGSQPAATKEVFLRETFPVLFK